MTLEPKTKVINRLPKTTWDDIVFEQRVVTYNGFARLTGNSPIILRILLLQRKVGGEIVLAPHLEMQEVFGQREEWDPVTIASPISDRYFTKLSDRHYLVVPNASGGMEISYRHRLSHNYSLQTPRISDSNEVRVGPIYIVAYADLSTEDDYITLQRFNTDVCGNTSTVARLADEILDE